MAIRVKPEAKGLRIVQVYIAEALGSGLLRQDDLVVEIDGVPTTGITEDTFHDLIHQTIDKLFPALQLELSAFKNCSVRNSGNFLLKACICIGLRLLPKAV